MSSGELATLAGTGVSLFLLGWALRGLYAELRRPAPPPADPRPLREQLLDAEAAMLRRALAVTRKEYLENVGRYELLARANLETLAAIERRLLEIDRERQEGGTL